eukprot:742723-Pelagomonas_calceolata.AAC.5
MEVEQGAAPQVRTGQGTWIPLRNARERRSSWGVLCCRTRKLTGRLLGLVRGEGTPVVGRRAWSRWNCCWHPAQQAACEEAVR